MCPQSGHSTFIISDLLIFKSKLLSLADGESYEKNVEEFYKKCGDSERPGLFDRYKYKCFNNEEHRGLGIVMYFVIFIIYSILMI